MVSSLFSPSSSSGGPALGLHSTRSMQRLEQIAQLRARGIGNRIALPQLVVCGDQSAGKSSVLEGLTGIPFPRQDGLCTTFATEIILQHATGEMVVTASIIPGPGRTADEAAALGKYRSSMKDFDNLATVIDEVSRLMGIRRPGSASSGPTFVEDVLRIEVEGPTSLHLSVVDLPGLISVPNEEQTESDVQTVHRLVDDYVANRRTIILAVVQAGNDIANQAIIQKSRRVDPAGERTVGIITKPDLINQGTEKRIALLASNKDSTKLKLGFFLVKNPTPNELAKGITTSERHQNENQYFQSSPWKEQTLDPDRTGILALRNFLQQLLDKHIERELPQVRDEISTLLHKTEEKLEAMGEERSDTARMRSFLTRIAMSFHRLASSALDGTYYDVEGFFSLSNQPDGSHRLRAMVENGNLRFADAMRDRGQKRRVQDVAEDEDSDASSDDSEEPEHQDEQIVLSEKGMKRWIRKMYASSRAKELAGTYNQVLLTELFHEQASPWYQIVSDHVEEIAESIEEFVHAVLQHVVPDHQVLVELKELIATQLRSNTVNAQRELERLWEDEQHQPMTYNHYFTDNIQKARQQSSEAMLRRAMDQTRQQDWNGKMHVSNVSVDLEELLNGLQHRIKVDMNEQACAEALASLEAYYKVARKTFVDNACRQVVERHLLRPLTRAFSPDIVATMTDDDLTRIAGETSDRVAARREMQELQEDLRVSMQELRGGRNAGKGVDHSVGL